MARQLYYITIDLTVELNDKEAVSNSVFDQVSVHLLDIVILTKTIYLLKLNSDGL